jgi:xylose isomerase
VGYDGPRHFDAHAYRTEDVDGVKEFARGCMRTYLILKEKAQRWNKDREIQGLLSEMNANVSGHVGKYSRKTAQSLLSKNFDRAQLSQKGLNYEKLDQLTIDVLLGVR